MKNNHNLTFAFFVLLLLCALSLPANAQTGCNTGVVLTTQTEVDAFSFTGVFDGSIQIGDAAIVSDITNLDALSDLTAITNNLTIKDNPVLTDISGLSNLTFVGQSPCQSQRLTIWNNPLLADLSAFTNVTFSQGMRGLDLRSLPSLTSLGGLVGITETRSIIMIDLDALTSLTGLENLTAVSFIEVRSNAQLADINALANVTVSWNPANESTNIKIEDNPSLANLNGLAGLTDLSLVEIINCDALQNLSGMGAFLSVAGELEIADNDGMTSLEGLNPDLVIGTRVVLTNNTQLSSCAYDPVCDQITQGGQQGQVIISGNATGCADVAEVTIACAGECGENVVETLTDQAEVDAFATNYPGCRNFLGDLIIDEAAIPTGGAITDLSALSSLRQVNGFSIMNAPALTDLSPLSGLDSIHGNFFVRSTAVTDLDAFGGLYKVGLRLSIFNNPLLETVSDFSNLIAVGSQFSIRNNPMLTDLSGFANLETVGDEFEIAENPSLADLNDFTSIRFAYDGVLIEDNDLFTSLAGLESLENINGTLRIVGNDMLADISALENIDQESVMRSTGGVLGSAGLVIMDNPLLSNCSIITVCTFLEGSGTSVMISGNTTGCIDEQEVEAACSLLPIRLVTFNARRVGKWTTVDWQTAAEENVQEYSLERSTNGGYTFHHLVRVAAQNTSGASYEYIDESALEFSVTGLYYRLRAQDFDGAEEVFGPLFVALNGELFTELTVSPNPVFSNNEIRIQGAVAGAKLALTAVDGRRIKTLSPISDGNYQLPELKPGVYLIRSLEGRSKGQVARFVVR